MADGDSAVKIFRAMGDGKFKEESAAQFGLALKGKGVSCAVGDYDNDGKNDLAVALSDRVVLFHNDGGGKFSDVTAKVGITALNEPAGMTFVDYDHDSDLDLFVTGKRLSGVKDSTDNVVWRNNGNGTFTNWTKEAGFAGEGATTSVVLSDINNDRAVDLVVTGANGAPTVYLNQREGPFKAMPLYDAAGLAPATGVYVLDFNKDGWMDVALTHAGAPGVSLWRNVDGTHFERVPLPIADATEGWGITAIDFDNDGWIDLAAVVETPKGTEVRVFRNKGVAGLRRCQRVARPRQTEAPRSASVDRRRPRQRPRRGPAGDAVERRPGGAAQPGWQQEPRAANRLQGLGRQQDRPRNESRNLRQRHVAEVRSRGRRGLLEPGAAGDSRRDSARTTNADIVRMLWPTGVLQDEIDVAANKPASFLELDRRGSSCPTLFAWNGEKYEFITDVIGAGVIGHWISPTSKKHARPRRVGQDRRLEAARQRRLPERAFRRAHGGSQLHRPTAHGRRRSSRGCRCVSRRALPRRSSVCQRQDRSDLAAARSRRRVGQPGQRRAATRKRARPPVRARLHQPAVRRLCQYAFADARSRHMDAASSRCDCS